MPIVNLGKCDNCPAQVRWAYTASGARMPLDPNPDPAGNFVIDRLDERNNEHGHVLKKDEDPVGLRYVPHFATCPAKRRKK